MEEIELMEMHRAIVDAIWLEKVTVSPHVMAHDLHAYRWECFILSLHHANSSICSVTINSLRVFIHYWSHTATARIIINEVTLLIKVDGNFKRHLQVRDLMARDLYRLVICLWKVEHLYGLQIQAPWETITPVQFGSWLPRLNPSGKFDNLFLRHNT